MQGDELRGLAGLARDAAEILFEMAALRDESEAAQDMLEKVQQLEVRYAFSSTSVSNWHPCSYGALQGDSLMDWPYAAA